MKNSEIDEEPGMPGRNDVIFIHPQSATYSMVDAGQVQWPRKSYGGFHPVLSKCICAVGDLRRRDYKNLCVIGVHYTPNPKRHDTGIVQVGITGTASKRDAAQILELTDSEFCRLRRYDKNYVCSGFDDCLTERFEGVRELLDRTVIKETAEECGLYVANPTLLAIDCEHSMRKTEKQCWGGFVTPVQSTSGDFEGAMAVTSGSEDCINFKIASVVYGDMEALFARVSESVYQNRDRLLDTLSGDNIQSICLIPIDVALRVNRDNPYRPWAGDDGEWIEVKTRKTKIKSAALVSD